MAAAAPMAESAASKKWLGLLRGALGFYWLAFFVGTHWPSLRMFRQAQTAIPLDKMVHAVGFAVLVLLLIGSGVGRAVGRWLPGGGDGGWAGGWVGGWWSWRSGVGAVLVTAVYAVLDEWTQQFVGRQMGAMDLVADAVGVAVGLGVAGCVAGWWSAEVGGSGSESGEETSGLTSGADEETSGRGGETSGGGGGFVGHAAVVSGLTLVSRVLGLVRDAVLLAMFGASQTMSAFFFGFMVPNLFRRLFGEGALTAAFLPRYRRLLDDDPVLAGRYARLCGARVMVMLVGLVVAGELALWGLWAWGDWTSKGALALGLTAVMLPYAPLICGVAFWGAVLQAKGRFGPAAFVPVLLNVGMIGASGLAAWWSADATARVFVVAVGVLVCGVMQGVWVWGALRGGGGDAEQPDVSARSFSAAARGEGEGAALRTLWRGTLVAMLPMLVGLGVFQINTLLDGLIAYGLSPPEVAPEVSPEVFSASPEVAREVSAALAGGEKLVVFGREMEYPVGVGAMATLTAAQRLYQFPLGVFGIAIATAIFPALSAAGRDEDRAAFGRVVRRGVRLTWFIALPATVGLLLVRGPLARVMFERGAFDAGDAGAVSWVLLGYGAGVWAYSLTHVLTRAFYARDDAKTPLRVAVCMVGLNLGLNVVLVWPLGAAGLAWSTAISASVQALVLLWLLGRHVDGVLSGGVMGGVVRAGVGAVAMAAAVWAVVAVSVPAEVSWAGALATLGLMVSVGGGVYVLVTGALRSAELGWLVKR